MTISRWQCQKFLTMTTSLLSEKAKGKQRAVVPPSLATPIPPQDLTRDLIIRFSEGVPDLSVAVNQRDTVQDIKTAVRFCPSFAFLMPKLFSCARYEMRDQT